MCVCLAGPPEVALFAVSFLFFCCCVPVLFASFEFISALVDDPGHSQLFPPILPNLAYYLIVLMQVSSEQVPSFPPPACTGVVQLGFLPSPSTLPCDTT